MELFKNHYVAIDYNAESSLLQTIWFSASEDMEDDEYKYIIEKRVVFFKQYKPKYFLSDARNFRYIIKPTLQQWNYDNSLKVFKELGCQKMAMVNSKDFVSQVSIEQTIETDPDINSMYFDDIEAAHRWFNE